MSFPRDQQAAGPSERRRRLLILAAIGIVIAIAVPATLGAIHGFGQGTARSEILRGTSGNDKIVGEGGNDKIYGYGGNDRLFGGDGNDTINGGPGQDRLGGGPGDDQIQAKDGQADVVGCGPGVDHVLGDDSDRVASDCEYLNGTAHGGTAGEVTQNTIGDSKRVVLVDEQFRCTGPVDLDLVKVTMKDADFDAISLDNGCTGRIGRIEVDTWKLDGVKVQNSSTDAAHDLVVEGGYVRCYDHVPGAHQDGIQVMGGNHLTFENLELNCNSHTNSQFFVSQGGAHVTTPTDAVCKHCFLGTGAASTLRVSISLRSGAEDSLLCQGRFFDAAFAPGSEEVVDVGNRILPVNDKRCEPVSAP